LALGAPLSIIMRFITAAEENIVVDALAGADVG